MLLTFFYSSFLGKCHVAVADLLSFEQVDSENSTSLPLVILALFEGSEHYGLLFNKYSQFFQGGQVRRPLTVGNM